MKVEIVDMLPEHAEMLAKDMREEDTAELLRFGVDPKLAVELSYRSAVYKKAALVDGELAAVWGVTPREGSGTVGEPWLLIGNVADRASKFLFANVYRQQLNHMRTLFPVLENWCDALYTRSLRLLKIHGFELSPPSPFGVKNALFVRFRWEDNAILVEGL